MSYNVLNLPSVVRRTDNTDCSLTYTYLGDGTRLKVMTAQDGGKAYRGSFVYALDSDGEESLESIAWDEGRILIGTDGEVIQDQWHVKDHLGNVRAVVDLSAPAGTSASVAVKEQSDYLPFGTRLALKTDTGTDNRHRYAGKEEQRYGSGTSSMDLGLLDFGARFYDPFTARWTSVDPLAAKYPSISPYAYCSNDPINFVDLDGKERVLKRKEDENIIIISATYIYDKSEFNDSVIKAVNLLNNKTGHTYTDPKSQIKYAIRFQLKAVEKSSDDAEFAEYAPGTNKIVKRGKEAYTKDGKFIVGGTILTPPNDLVEIYKYSVNDILSIAHEIIHTLGGIIL